MTPAERFIRALRDAAEAFEELQSGKQKPRRHRGPVRVDVSNVPDEAKRLADAHLRKVGVR